MSYPNDMYPRYATRTNKHKPWNDITVPYKYSFQVEANGKGTGQGWNKDIVQVLSYQCHIQIWELDHSWGLYYNGKWK